MPPPAGRLLPTSLTGRLIVTVVAFVAIVSVLIAVTTTVVLRSYLMNRLDDEVDRSLGRVQTAIRGDRDGDDRPEVAPPTPRGSVEGSISALINANGTRGTSVTRSGRLRALDATALAALQDVEPNQAPRTVEVPGYGSFRVAGATTRTGAVVVQGSTHVGRRRDDRDAAPVGDGAGRARHRPRRRRGSLAGAPPAPTAASGRGDRARGHDAGPDRPARWARPRAFPTR